MDMSAYNTTSHSLLPHIGGGGFESIEQFSKKWVGENHMFAFGLLIALVLIIIWLVWWKPAEKLTAGGVTRCGMSQDQTNVGGGDGTYECLDSGRAQSAFAQQVQSGGGGSFVINPAAGVNQPGSLGYQILHSPQFHCDTKPSAPQNAWAWMQAAAVEPFAKGIDDDKLSLIGTGV